MLVWNVHVDITLEKNLAKWLTYLSNLSPCLYQHADLQEMPNSVWIRKANPKIKLGLILKLSTTQDTNLNFSHHRPRSSLVPTLCQPRRPGFLLHPRIHIRADPRSLVTSDKVQRSWEKKSVVGYIIRHPCCNGHPRNSCQARCWSWSCF